MVELSSLYQELILEHANNPRNYGIPASTSRPNCCPCGISRCDKIYKLYYVLNKTEDSYRLTPMAGTEYHVKNWTDDEIYGPYSFIESI